MYWIDWKLVQQPLKHLVMSFVFSFIDIIEDSIKPYIIDKNNQFQTVVTFDCRGVEPVDFSPRVCLMSKPSHHGYENILYMLYHALNIETGRT